MITKSEQLLNTTESGIDVAIRDIKNGKEFNLFPVTLVYNIIVSIHPEVVTLDTLIQKQKDKNILYDSGLEKLQTIESYAQVNQNTFSSIYVGGKPITSKKKTDTLFVDISEDFITKVDDTTNTVTVAIKEYDKVVSNDHNGLMTPLLFAKLNNIEDNANNYKHPKSGVTAGKYREVMVDEDGHVVQGDNPILPIEEGGTGCTNLDEIKDKFNIPDQPIDEMDYSSSRPISAKGIFKLLNDKAEKDHGIHVPEFTRNDTKRFLREGNFWSDIPQGDLTDTGILQLSNEYLDGDITKAATPKAVRDAMYEAEKYAMDQISALLTNSGSLGGAFQNIVDYINTHGDEYLALCKLVNTKVDAVDGKGLSTYDFNDEWIARIAHISDVEWMARNNERNKINEIRRNGVTLAISAEDEGRYVDIAVPTKVSELTNDKNYISAHPATTTPSSTLSNSSLSFGNSFTVVTGVTVDSFGHANKIDSTKFNLPSLPVGGNKTYGVVKTTSGVTSTNDTYEASPIINGTVYNRKSFIDVRSRDPSNPPTGYMWIVP